MHEAIDKKIDILSREVDKLSGDLREHISTTKLLIEKHSEQLSMAYRDIYGEAFDRPGMKAYVDRLNNSHKNMSFYQRAFALPIIGILAERAYHFFRG